MGKRVWSAAASLAAALLFSTAGFAAAAPSMTVAANFVGPVWNGTDTKYIIDVSNTGILTLTNVGFSATFPSGMSSIAQTQNLCSGHVTITTTGFSVTGMSINPASACEAEVYIKTSHAGHYSMTTSSITSNLGSIPGVTRTLDVLSPPVVSLKLSSTSVIRGFTSTLTFSVANPSPNVVGLQQVNLSISLGAGIPAVPATKSMCGGLVTISAASIQVSGASIAAGGTCSQTATIQGGTLGTWPIKAGGATSVVASGKIGTGSPASATVSVINLGIKPSLMVSILPIDFSTPTPTPASAATAYATAAPTASPAPSESPSPSGEASGSGDLETASAGPSASDGQLIAGASEGGPTASIGPGMANASTGGGGDSIPLLLVVLGAVAVVAAGGGSFFLVRRARLGGTGAAPSGDSPKE